MCGGPVNAHAFPAVDLGGTYSQYLRAPITYHRRFGGWDLVVDVENGVPFFSPAWRRGPVVCLVHHVHVDQWQMYFRRPVAWVGRTLEARAMPRVYRKHLFVAVSPSTAASVIALGVDPARVRVVEMGTDPAHSTVARSDAPLFFALGRLVAHKRVDRLLAMWERVRPVTGGRLVIAGDGPDLDRLRAAAGPGAELLGAVSEADKRRLLAEAWLLVHPAAHEGWGTVIMEAAALGTPAVAFDVRGVCDSVVDGETGVLAADEDAFVAAWSRLATDRPTRDRLSERARARAATFTWQRAVDEFEAVAHEAVDGDRTA